VTDPSRAPNHRPNSIHSRNSGIGPLRARRKRFASVCLFAVLTSAMFGVQVWIPFPLWLTAVLVVAIGLFTRRAHASKIPYGWV